MKYSNDSYIAESYYDNLYERAESVNQNEPVECPECEGTGDWSHCCGAVINDNECQDCKQFCIHVQCHVCKGSGEIED